MRRSEKLRKRHITFLSTALYECPDEGTKEKLLMDEVDDYKFLTGLFHVLYEELPVTERKKDRNDFKFYAAMTDVHFCCLRQRLF